MRRREFISLIGGAVAWPLAARAQRSGPWRIGQVRAGTPEAIGPSAGSLEEQLRHLGYAEGNNIVLTSRYVAPQPEAMEAAIRELLPQIDLLVAWGTLGGVLAKKLVPSLPVVFVSVGAPVDIGLVSSLAHPDGNMTGITFEASSETYAKRLQMLVEIVPSLRRVAVLRAPRDPNVPFAMSSLQKSAPLLGVTLLPIDFGTEADLPEAFAEMRRQEAEGVISIAGNLTAVSGKRIAELALVYSMPSCHPFREIVAAGGLIGLGPDRAWMGRQAATYVDKIIRGSQPADLPVQQPDRYEVYINLNTARALGIKMPDSILARADEVIE